MMRFFRRPKKKDMTYEFIHEKTPGGIRYYLERSGRKNEKQKTNPPLGELISINILFEWTI